MKSCRNKMEDPLSSLNGEISNEATTTGGAQFLAPSVAKTERGGGHSQKVEVPPRLHK